MRKKFVAAVAAFAALCGMVSVPTCRSATGMTVRATGANRLTRISSTCLTATVTKLMRTP